MASTATTDDRDREQALAELLDAGAEHDRRQAALDRHPMAGRSFDQLAAAAERIRKHGTGLADYDVDVTLAADAITAALEEAAP